MHPTWFFTGRSRRKKGLKTRQELGVGESRGALAWRCHTSSAEGETEAVGEGSGLPTLAPSRHGPTPFLAHRDRRKESTTHSTSLFNLISAVWGRVNFTNESADTCHKDLLICPSVAFGGC